MRIRLPRRRIWRVVLYLGSFLLVLIAADMLYVQSLRKIRPGYDTTRITSPVQPDGSIDYLLAVDGYFAHGVTSENNAAVPLIQAMGRNALSSAEPPDGITERLGMPHLPEAGDYFVTYEDYCKKRSNTPTQWTDLTHPRLWPVTFDEITTQWIKDREKSLELATQASKRTRFFIPLYAGLRHETMIEILLPYIAPLRDLGRALTSRALLRLGADDVNGFREDLATAHRLARLIGQSSTAVGRMVAVTMEISACEAERVGISSGKIPADVSRAMAAELAEMGDLPPLDEVIDHGERYFALDTLQVLARKSPPDAGRLLNSLVGPDRRLAPPVVFLLAPIAYGECMRSVNQADDGVLAALRQPTYPQRAEALNTWLTRLDHVEPWEMELRDLLFPNWPAKLLTAAWTRAMSHMALARIESQLTQIALALNAYHQDHGEYPSALSDLSPHDLKTIPNDLFTEKPLHYARTDKGYTLYSAGPNMSDDGGKTDSPYDDVDASRH
jgi:hypothetical protein